MCARARVCLFIQVQTKDGYLGRIVRSEEVGGKAVLEVKIPGLNETRKVGGADVMDPVAVDDMARILEQVGVLGLSTELQKRKGGTPTPIKTNAPSPQKSVNRSPAPQKSINQSPSKGANISTSSAVEEDYVDEDESDVDSDDSLADIGSSEDEETADKRKNFKPPKLEPEGNEWRCNVCRVINDEGIPKCVACDTKNPNAIKTEAAKPAASAIQFGFGGGAGASAGGGGAPAIKFGFGSAPASAGGGAAATAQATSSPFVAPTPPSAPITQPRALNFNASPAKVSCSLPLSILCSRLRYFC